MLHVTVTAALLVFTPSLFVPPQETTDPAAVQEDSSRPGLPGIAEFTETMARHDGLLTFYVDQDKGAVWLEIPSPDTETGEAGRYIYFDAMRGGLGSNDIGIDRGQLGDSRVIHVRRIGPKVVFEQPNLSFRAISDDERERNAVRESFASSIIWGGDISALDDDGASLIDITSFLVRDAHGIVRTLRGSNQGSFSLAKDRSFVELNRCHAFPDNLEFEATLTYAGDAPGGFVRSTTPDPHAVTLIQRHALVRLPDDGYTPRRFDPRIASFSVGFLDYVAPLGEPMERKWISRHRLAKANPDADRSPAVEPIVYYVDHGAPEPIRSALVEGARWWNQAFEAAGFDNAFQVEVLPDDVHPLDARYNVIQWVHRSTRGWSYGGSITDPRTGEIIKGHVSLGSLRVRQDIRIFEGLMGTANTGSGRANDPITLALARIRQLSAHEVGHTLGFAHNFAGSTYDGRASVMDYPSPWILARRGELDASRAYAVDIGSWDKLCVRYAYTEYPDQRAERRGLTAIVAESVRDHRFVSDADSRAPSAAHPQGNLWDNGADPIAELVNVMEVRRIALNSFRPDRIAIGQPMALLQEVLAPIYFYHRYQLDAVGKLIGGVNYAYAVRGDGQPATRPVDAATQRRALDALLATIEPQQLVLSQGVIESIAPRAFGYGGNRELFAGSTSPSFDWLSAATSAADAALGQIFQPQRLARVLAQHGPAGGGMSLQSVLSAVAQLDDLARIESEPVSATTSSDRMISEITRAVQTLIVDRMIALASDSRTTAGVRGCVEDTLRAMRSTLSARGEQLGGAQRMHAALIISKITRFLERTTDLPLEDDSAQSPPPGSPIGATTTLDYGSCSRGIW